MDLLSNLKLMLDIAGADLDAKLSLIIDQSNDKLLARLPNTEAVPEELEYIVLELAVIRFNRINNEGMASYSQEGESISYGSDIAEFESDIQAWLNKQEDNRIGVVRFL